MQSTKNKTDEWHGCYNDRWNGLIISAAKTHPAKFQRGVLTSIIDHCLHKGFIRTNDTVLDPFAGIGCGGIVCAYRGLQWRGFEIEKNYANMAQMNFEFNRYKWQRRFLPIPTITHDDAMQADLGKNNMIISSPPRWDDDVATAQTNGSQIDQERYIYSKKMQAQGKHGVKNNPGRMHDATHYYGIAKGQLGQMQEKEYWKTMHHVVTRCLMSLYPRGVAVWVLKDFVRDGKRVWFGNQWESFCQERGFKTVCRHRSMIKETYKKNTLDGLVDYTCGRESFFSKMHRSHGLPAIDWHDIICMRKQ